MSAQKKSGPRERVVQFAVATTAPTAGVLPHMQLSRRSRDGRPVEGFSFALFAPDSGGAAIAAAGDFTVTIYRLAPTLRQWFSGSAVTGVAFNQQYICTDFGGGASLFFHITNVGTPGNVLALVGELF